MNGANGVDGADGADGAGCTAVPKYATPSDTTSEVIGATITCGEGDPIDIMKGANGADGTNGINGINGANGADGVGCSAVPKYATPGDTTSEVIGATITCGDGDPIDIMKGADGADGTGGTC